MIVAAVIGILLVTVLAAMGRRQSLDTHTGWSIGNRGMSSLTTFFLQAGAIFTSFTFLGMSGLTVLGGVSATYMPAYLVLGYIGMFLIGPVVWKLGKVFSYHTNADMVGHQFRSPLLGKLVALVSVIFFVPIVQVQIVGLGTMVSFATGQKSAGNASMIVATVLILLFVGYAGLRGVASAAYFKDVAMVVALLVILFGVLVRYSGEWGLDGVMSEAGDMLTVDPGSQTYGIIWFVTSVIVSGIGLGGMTLPESWPAVLSANGSRAVSKNHVMLPLYTLATFVPIIIGFYAATHLEVGKGEENSAILTIAQDSLPGWLMGAVLIAGISCAIVPAAHCVLSIATLVSSNLTPAGTTDGRRLMVGKISAGVILLASLWLSLTRPDLMANLYLLTYAGLAQLAPANILSCTRSTLINARGLIAGLVVGEVIVIAYTIAGTNLWGVNNGVTGLVANLVVMVAVSLATGRAERPRFPDMPTRRVSAPAPTDVNPGAGGHVPAEV
ncbi:sodium:solute symporter [uncultured Corynebacterium sp.]|uniref:sodium:solute symporter family protein n=1 Tax=uncultured Corynebacterium sp. TaxID=159447 RepID=UPI0025EA0C6A|nr:sodium:solute symporter family protein [uncultured Corynebacterium sp.]